MYFIHKQVIFWKITLSFAVLVCMSSCQVFLPDPPILPVSKCHNKPLACPPPYPCAPVDLPDICKPLNLAQLVDLGLYNSPLTRQGWANSRVAAANLGQANSAFFPDIAVTWTTTRSLPAEIPNTGAIAIPVTTYVPQLTVSYLLWDFGGRVGAMENARESLIAAGWNYSWTVQTVMFNVIQAYYNYLSAMALLEADIQDMKDAEVAVLAAEAMFTSGVNTIVDVYQAKAQYVNTEMTVVQQRGAVETTRATLAVALGLSPDTCLNITKPEHLPVERISCDIERMLAEAKCCRPDLEGLRAGIRAQEATIMQQYSALWPTINGQFTGGRTYVHNDGHDNHDFSESLIVNIPIFSGFSTVNAIRQAEAQADSLIAGFKNQELQALLTVVTNYFAVKTAIETFEYSKVYLKYAQEAFDAVLFGYRAGNKMIIDVLNAETTLSNARSSYIQSEFNWFTSIANLAYSRGVLISNELKKEGLE
ncbi:MAG: TolC family protein [Chlamydiales bacterium]|nr:TolC family protein [Chlamydiales bacterium]